MRKILIYVNVSEIQKIINKNIFIFFSKNFPIYDEGTFMDKYSYPSLIHLITLDFFCLAFLTGCQINVNPSHINSINQNPESISALTNHEYSEIKHLKIFWSQIFLIEKDSYYVYLYSETCSHCAQIKNSVIEYALSNISNTYFVQESSSVVIDEVKAMNINVLKLEDLGIRGYPTLLSLKKKVVTNQYSGVTAIKNELHI